MQRRVSVDAAHAHRIGPAVLAKQPGTSWVIPIGDDYGLSPMLARNLGSL